MAAEVHTGASAPGHIKNVPVEFGIRKTTNGSGYEAQAVMAFGGFPLTAEFVRKANEAERVRRKQVRRRRAAALRRQEAAAQRVAASGGGGGPRPPATVPPRSALVAYQEEVRQAGAGRYVIEAYQDSDSDDDDANSSDFPDEGTVSYDYGHRWRRSCRDWDHGKRDFAWGCGWRRRHDEATETAHVAPDVHGRSLAWSDEYGHWRDRSWRDWDHGQSDSEWDRGWHRRHDEATETAHVAPDVHGRSLAWSHDYGHRWDRSWRDWDHGQRDSEWDCGWHRRHDVATKTVHDALDVHGRSLAWK
ncbi:unnamed protein product [Prorocentrum cordatum]|uniref:Uncharacterized protein n=1 Tax=Prorocentrum cordatum TaxID=2364126 RepID=A0ABN9QSE9_9DINO|nr:unnamed protein product [Polarella glacialis]